MTSIIQLRGQVVTMLKSWIGFAGTQILPEFSGKPYEFLKEKSRIVVGLHQIKLSPAGFGQHFGNHEGMAFLGAWGEITFSFRCMVPNNAPQLHCHLLMEQLSQCLVESNLGFYEIWCQDVLPSSTEFASRLTCFGTLRASIGSEKPFLPVEQIIVKGGLTENYDAK